MNSEVMERRKAKDKMAYNDGEDWMTVLQWMKNLNWEEDEFRDGGAEES